MFDPTPVPTIVLTAEQAAQINEWSFYVFLLIAGGALFLVLMMTGRAPAQYGRR